MSTIDRLKELAMKADAVKDMPGNDEATDRTENFDFAYALVDAWPKLLAFFDAAKNSYHGPHHPKECELCKAIAAMEES